MPRAFHPAFPEVSNERYAESESSPQSRQLPSQHHQLNEAPPNARQHPSATPSVPQSGGSDFLSGDSIRSLFHTVLDLSSNEDVQLYAIERIFLFFVRNPYGVDAVVQSGGIPYSFRCFVRCSNVIVRNYAVLMLKTISERHFVEVLKNMGEWGMHIVSSISEDSSPDVRNLLCEMLKIVFRKVPASFSGFPLKTQLAQSLRKCLDTETSFAVLRSVYTFLETVFVIEATVSAEDPLFIVSCLNCLIHAKLIQSIALPEQQISSLAARTLRSFIQFCPPSEMIGRSMIEDFSMWRPLVTVLLGGETAKDEYETDSERNVPEESANATQMKRIRDVEISVALALLYAVDPVGRRAMHAHFSQKKLWLSRLRKILISHLEKAGEHFYKDIAIIDCTGRLMNDISKVQWVYKRKREASLEQPDTESLQLVFVSQEQRVHVHSMATFAGSPMMFIPGGESSLSSQDPLRQSRLTLCVLRLAVVLALPDESRMQPRLTESELAWVSDGSLSDRRHWMIGQPSTHDADSESRESCISKNEDRYPILDENRRFDNIMILVLQFTSYYTKKSDLLPSHRLYNEIFTQRRPITKKNPWNLPNNVNKLRKWTMDDVQADFLFDFDVPFHGLDEHSAELWLNRARRHFIKMKKALLQTPQREKGTRWFLYDMLHNAMPQIQDLFATIVALMQKHGRQEMQFAISMFRSREIHKGETSIHPGNIIDIVDQIQYYFSSNETVPERIETSERFRSLEDAIRKLKMNDALQKEESEDELNDGLLDDDEEEAAAIARARRHLAEHGSSPLSLSTPADTEPDINEEIARMAGKRALMYENVDGGFRRKFDYPDHSSPVPPQMPPSTPVLIEPSKPLPTTPSTASVVSAKLPLPTSEVNSVRSASVKAPSESGKVPSEPGKAPSESGKAPSESGKEPSAQGSTNGENPEGGKDEEKKEASEEEPKKEEEKKEEQP